MNITGNIRYRSTDEQIEKAVMRLLKRKRYDAFSVKDICMEAGINRSSFYAHYMDINDLMIKIESGFAKQMDEIFGDPNGHNERMFIRFFEFVKSNREFYKAFLKTNCPSFTAPKNMERQKKRLKEYAIKNGYEYDEAEYDYHLWYFGGGLKTVCTLWLNNNCRETPEQMAKIIFNEYNRTI